MSKAPFFKRCLNGQEDRYFYLTKILKYCYYLNSFLYNRGFIKREKIMTDNSKGRWDTNSRDRIGRKIINDPSKLSEVCGIVKARGEKIVLMSGCFDIVHGGHLDGICDACQYGKLVIGINDDDFVRRLKGENRPIRSQEERAYLMAGFAPVHLVTIFRDDYDLIRVVKPNFYIASMTSHVRIWDDHKRIELLKEVGTEVVEFGLEKRNSTTRIIEIILKVQI